MTTHEFLADVCTAALDHFGAYCWRTEIVVRHDVAVAKVYLAGTRLDVQVFPGNIVEVWPQNGPDAGQCICVNTNGDRTANEIGKAIADTFDID
jgi:hypothetical protein